MNNTNDTDTVAMADAQGDELAPATDVSKTEGLLRRFLADQVAA